MFAPSGRDGNPLADDGKPNENEKTNESKQGGKARKGKREMLYINPYRRTKDGRPYYQKSRPHLKSAFADRRKTRIHSRSEFRQKEVIAHIGNVWIIHEAGDFGYSVSCESEGCPWGAMSIVQANAIAANYRNQDVMNWGACDNVVIGANAFYSAELPTGLEAR